MSIRNQETPMTLTNNQNEPQKVTLDIIFETRHNPFTEGHAREILRSYFQSKGVKFDGDKIVV